jgi:uncharacterized protein (DUF4415 family)
MTKSVKSIEGSWNDPDEAPSLTQEWADSADAYHGKKLVRRGRPKLENPKQQVSLRLDPEVIEVYRASGSGWQARVNETLRTAAGLGSSVGRSTGENYMTTGKKDASAASKTLSNPNSSKASKSVAASDLSRAKHKGK